MPPARLTLGSGCPLRLGWNPAPSRKANPRRDRPYRLDRGDSPPGRIDSGQRSGARGCAAPAAARHSLGPGRPPGAAHLLSRVLRGRAAAELVATCTGGTVLTAWALHLGATPFVIGLLGPSPWPRRFSTCPAHYSRSCSDQNQSRSWPLALGLGAAAGRPALPSLAVAAESRCSCPWRWPPPSLACSATTRGRGGVDGRLVPSPLRGRFFGRRTILHHGSRHAGLAQHHVALDAATPLGLKPAMLSGLAALACVAGIVSVGLLLRQAAPRRVHDRKRPELRALARAAIDPRIRPWLRYLLCWNAAVALSASFFSSTCSVTWASAFPWSPPQ